MRTLLILLLIEAIILSFLPVHPMLLSSPTLFRLVTRRHAILYARSSISTLWLSSQRNGNIETRCTILKVFNNGEHLRMMTATSNQDSYPNINLTDQIISSQTQNVDINTDIDSPSTEFASGLIEYIRKRISDVLTLANVKHPGNVTMDVSSVANSFVEDIVHYNASIKSNQDLRIISENIIKEIESNSSILPLILLPSTPQQQRVNIDRVLMHRTQRIEGGTQLFTNIITHHDNLVKTMRTHPSPTQSNLLEVIPDQALHQYARAAVDMGTKPWVQKGIQWMDNFAYCFFRMKGAKKFYLRQLDGFPVLRPAWLENLLYHHLSNDLMAFTVERGAFTEDREVFNSERESFSEERGKRGSSPKLIRLLDVGSCYNPMLSISEHPEAFDVMAIDLRPAHPSVFICDFLQLEIGPPGSLPLLKHNDRLVEVRSLEEIPLSTRDQYQLLRMPANHFDVVTMSLVLSYLPTSDMREVMIQQAKQLLVHPPRLDPIALTIQSAKNSPHPSHSPNQDLSQSPNPDLPHSSLNPDLDQLRLDLQQRPPHRYGLLLIIEKQSIFGRITPQPSPSSSVSRPLGGGEDPVYGHSQLLHLWKQRIQQIGFRIVKYRPLRFHDLGRTSHAFAFVTHHDPLDPVGEADPSTVYRLLIKRDFFGVDATKSQSIEEELDEDENARDDLRSDRPTSEMDPVNPVLDKETRSEIGAGLDAAIGIIGGGLGGCALALSLQRRGVSFLLFEGDRDFAARRQGYSLTMQQGGMALRTLGLRDDLLQYGVTSVAHQSFRSDGTSLGVYGAFVRKGCLMDPEEIHLDDLNKYRDDASSDPSVRSGNLRYRNVHIPRQKLRELLLGTIDPQHVKWGKRLQSIVPNEDSAIPNGSTPSPSSSFRCCFTDGSEYRVHGVVGADGIYSVVRNLSPSDPINSEEGEVKPLQYLGLMVILGISSVRSVIANFPGKLLTEKWSGRTDTLSSLYCQMQWLDGQTRVFAMPYDQEHTMWQLSYPLDEPTACRLSTRTNGGQGGQSLKTEALLRCEGWSSELIGLINNTDEDRISGHPVYDRDPSSLSPSTPDNLSERNITLLGDAAHPMSPFKGQGANQALLDAIDLSRAIVRSNVVRPDRRRLNVAFRDYERQMWERSAEKVLKSRTAAAYLHSPIALVEADITRAAAAEHNLLNHHQNDGKEEVEGAD